MCRSGHGHGKRTPLRPRIRINDLAGQAESGHAFLGVAPEKECDEKNGAARSEAEPGHREIHQWSAAAAIPARPSMNRSVAARLLAVACRTAPPWVT